MSEDESRGDQRIGRREIDGEIKMFIKSQEKVNDRIEVAITKMSEVIAKSDSMQVELNNQGRRIDELSISQSTTSDRLGELSGKVLVNSNIVTTMKQTKTMITGAIVTAVIGVVVTSVFSWTSSQSKDKSDQEFKKAIQHQQSETNKILKELSSK